VELSHQVSSFVAYTVSFVTILIVWVNHHAMFQAVVRVDRVLLFLNGFLKFVVSFISFPTAVLSRALQSSAYCRSAAVLYAVTLALASGCFALLWA
jgi:uncharacterized membrane protein